MDLKKINIISLKHRINISTNNRPSEIISSIPSFSYNYLKNTITPLISHKINLSTCLNIQNSKVFLSVTVGKITVVLDLDETLVHCFEELE